MRRSRKPLSVQADRRFKSSPLRRCTRSRWRQRDRVSRATTLVSARGSRNSPLRACDHRTMTGAVLLTALTLAFGATTASALAVPARAPSPVRATAAFGRLLHQIYGGAHGYWTCPPPAIPSPAIPGRVDCLAEVRTGRRWHQVSMSAIVRNRVIVFTTLTNDAATSWVRHWSPYSRRFIHEPQVPGVVSVNSPAYDWGWLAGLAGGLKPGQTRRLSALDGDVIGWERFDIFTCSARAGLITCRNALGDAMRYRP